MKSRLTRLRVALTAILGVGFVLIGWPVLLLAAAHGPLRTYLPDGSGLYAAVVDPGGLLLLLVLVGAVAAWFATAAALVVELVTQASGIQAPRLGRMFPQAPMSRLAGAALLVLPASGLLAPSAAVAAPAGTGVDPGTAASISSSSADRDCVPVKPRHHEVQPGESLWSIADEELGRGQRYPELFRASKGIRQPGGRSLTDPDVILPGWRIRIPAASQDAADSCDPRPAAGRGPARPLPELDRAPVADPGPSQGQAAPESPGLAGAAEVGESAATTGPATAPSPRATTAAGGDASAPTAKTGAPADLQVSGMRVAERSATAARLSWDATAGAAWYWVQVGGQSIRSATTEVTLDGLAPDAHHTVAVRAVAPDGRWGPAADLSFTTPDAAGTGPRPAAASRGTGGRASALALLALRPAGTPAAEVLARSIAVADLPGHQAARPSGPARCELGFAHLLATGRSGQIQRSGGHHESRRTAESLAKLRCGGPASAEQLLAIAGGPARRGTAITAMINSFGV